MPKCAHTDPQRVISILCGKIDSASGDSQSIISVFFSTCVTWMVQHCSVPIVYTSSKRKMANHTQCSLSHTLCEHACFSNRFVLVFYAPNYWVIGIELNSTKYIKALNSFILMLEYWDGWLLNVAAYSLREKETAVAKKKKRTRSNYSVLKIDSSQFGI